MRVRIFYVDPDGWEHDEIIDDVIDFQLAQDSARNKTLRISYLSVSGVIDVETGLPEPHACVKTRLILVNDENAYKIKIEI